MNVLRVVSEIIESNVFVCEKDGDFVVFDAGAKTEDVQNAIEKLKAKTSTQEKENANVNGLKGHVLGVFLTHGHYDHCFYALEYAKTFGCKIFVSEFAKEYLQDAKKNYSEGKFQVDDFSNFEFLHGDGALELGGFTVEYFALGGHSKSDVCYRVNDDLFVGDVLIGRDMGRIDLFGGSKKQMQKSLQKLVDLNYTTMHSGHGEDNSKFLQDKVAKLWLRFLSR